MDRAIALRIGVGVYFPHLPSPIWNVSFTGSVEKIAALFCIEPIGDIRALEQACFDHAYTLCERGEWPLLEPIVEELSVLVDRIGRTLLIKAMMQQKTVIVQNLIERNIAVIGPSIEGRDPLFYAASGAAGSSSAAYLDLISKKRGVEKDPPLQERVYACIQKYAIRQSLLSNLINGKVTAPRDVFMLCRIIAEDAKMGCYTQATLKCMWLVQQKLSSRAEDGVEKAKKEYVQWFETLLGFKPEPLETVFEQELLMSASVAEDEAIDSFLKTCRTRYVIQSNREEMRRMIKLLCGLNDVYRSVMRWDRVAKVLKIALYLPEEVQSPAFFVDLYRQMGEVQVYCGDYKEAEEFFRVALAKCEEKLPKSHPLLSQIYADRAYLYLKLGMLDVAQKDCEHALELIREASELPHPYFVPEILGRLASILYKEAKYSEARDRSNEALAHFSGFVDRDARNIYASALGNLSKSLQELKEYDEALKKAEQVLDLWRKEPSSPYNLSIALLDYANLLCKKGEEVRAEAVYKEAYEASKDDLGSCAIYAAALGRFYAQKGRNEEAASYSQEACTYFSALQKTIPYDEWRITYFSFQVQAYCELELALFKLEKLPEAFAISDARRATALCQTLACKVTGSANLSAMTFDEIIGVAILCQTTLVIYSMHGMVAVITKEGRADFITIDMESIPFVDTSALTSEFPYRGETRDPSFLQELYQNLNEDRDPTSSAQERMEKILNEKYRPELHKRLKKWYQDLIVPINVFLPKDPKATVTFILDGQMALLPFAAFETPDGGYFVEQHASLVAPSVRALGLLKQLQLAREAIVALPTSLVIGNPKNKERPLPFAEIEGREVATLLATSEDHVFLQERATVEHALAVFKEARWIHIACHGSYHAKMSDRSVYQGALYLAQDKAHEEGKLFAESLSKLDMVADLSFLSACYSGRGNIAFMHEGIVGITRAFMSAGVLTTAASLWKLPDTAPTVELIKTFYAHLLGKGTCEKLSKAAALQAAMVEAIRTRREAPDIWGSLFLTGLN